MAEHVLIIAAAGIAAIILMVGAMYCVDQGIFVKKAQKANRKEEAARQHELDLADSDAKLAYLPTLITKCVRLNRERREAVRYFRVASHREMAFISYGESSVHPVGMIMDAHKKLRDVTAGMAELLSVDLPLVLDERQGTTVELRAVQLVMSAPAGDSSIGSIKGGDVHQYKDPVPIESVTGTFRDYSLLEVGTDKQGINTDEIVFVVEDPQEKLLHYFLPTDETELVIKPCRQSLS